MTDNPRPRWMDWVALTTTVLAVCTAISTLRSSSCSTKLQINTTVENNYWAYFQSKSIKQHVCETQRDLFVLYQAEKRKPEEAKVIDKMLKQYNDDIARYDKEKKEIQAQAAATEIEQTRYKNKGFNFGLAAMLFQIAIMLSSVSALLKKMPLWIIGLGFGVVGIYFFINGFFLWF